MYIAAQKEPHLPPHPRNLAHVYWSFKMAILAFFIISSLTKQNPVAQNGEYYVAKTPRILNGGDAFPSSPSIAAHRLSGQGDHASYQNRKMPDGIASLGRTRPDVSGRAIKSSCGRDRDRHREGHGVIMPARAKLSRSSDRAFELQGQAANSFLPCKGRWRSEALTEGMSPFRERDTPPPCCA